MLKKCWIYYLIIVSLWSGCGLFFTACDEEEQQTWIRPEGLNSIDSYIKEGIMLKTLTEGNDHYALTFENKSVIKLPSNLIQHIQQDEEKWMTNITFTNNSEYSIPTVGKSLDKFVKEIKVNPSGFNPLAASIRMDLPSKGCFKIKVYAKEGAQTPDQEHRYDFVDNYTQEVILLGLYENYNNQIDLVFTDKEGAERAKTSIQIATDPLNIKRLPKHKLIKSKANEMEPGMTLVACPGEDVSDTSIPYMVDADGEIRWLIDWQSSKELEHFGAQCGPSRMKNGHFIAGNTATKELVEFDMLGNVVKKLPLEGYSFHHEVIETSNGNYLVTVSKDGARCNDGMTTRVNDFIIELDSKSGAILKSWDLTEMLDSSRYAPTDPSLPGAATGQTRGNWAHNNAILPWAADYLGSARFQGIFKYNAQGELRWIISPHKNWGPEYQKYLLTPLDQNGQPITDPDIVNGDKSGDHFDWAWGVHNPIVMSNGHILAFDNGYGRNFKLRPFSDRTQYSRIVEYEVDEANRTVRQVWQYGKGRNDCYAPAYSGVQELKQTGNYLFCPGMQNQLSDGSYGARIIEVNPKTNEVVYELEIKGQLFRGNRMPLYQ